MKRRTIPIVILSAAMLLCSCRPDKPEIMNSEELVSSPEVDTIITEYIGYDLEDLTSAWGEPDVIDCRYIWPVALEGETKFIEADIVDGKVEDIRCSKILFAVVTDVKDGAICFLGGTEGYTSDPAGLTICSDTDIYGNTAEPCRLDYYLIEYDGYLMETYPMQINTPYSLTYMGHVDEEEAEELEDIPGFLRDGV